MTEMAPGVALLLVVALVAFAIGVWARRWKRQMSQSGPKILSSVSLGQRERLVEVLHGGEILLLGVTSHHIAVLQARPASDKVRDSSDTAIPQAERTMRSTDLLDGTESRSQSGVAGRDGVAGREAWRGVGLSGDDLTGYRAHFSSVPSPESTFRAFPSAALPSATVWACLLAVLVLPICAVAQNLPLFEAVQGKGGVTNYSVPVQTVILLTALSFVPAMLMLMTSFTRILIVLSLLRQAMGLVTTPPNAVLIGLALFITAAVMAPVADKVYADAWQPYVAGRINIEQAIDQGVEPVKAFMLRQTRADDLNLFVRLSGKTYARPEEVPMTAVVPAFAISEIRTAFLIGFVIYLPFLAIDFAVASILTALGMVMVSPITFSLPLKLIVFVLADGWAMLVGGLVESFRMGG